jgi:tetratricopeptide (TPR) repeat protein
MDTPQTAPDRLTGLLLVNSDSPTARTHLPREVLLSAYQGVLARDSSRDDLVEHYKTLLQELTSDKSSSVVLSALAGAELAKGTSEGNRQAAKDLLAAVDMDSKSPKDYLLLSQLQWRDGDLGGAIKVLSSAIEKFPYNPAPYESLAACYLRRGDTAKALDILRRGLKLFPADKSLLQLAAKANQP